MKNAFKPLVYGCIAITGFIGNVHAQDLAYNKSNLLDNPGSLLSITGNNTAAAVERPAATVNTKVLNSFNRSYKNAANITWYEVNKKYLAMFDWQGLKSHALLGKNGWIIYDIQYGTEKNLPKNIRKSVKMAYDDYAIGSAVQVNVAGKNAWVISISDPDNLIILRAMDDDLEEMAHYDTHPPVQKLHRKAKIIIPRD